MIGFFIKKAFFDGWDNLISMVVHNLGYLVLLFAFFGVLSLVPSNLPFFLVIILGTGLLSFYTAGASSASWAYAHYQRPGWSDFKRGIRISWRHALLFWILFLLIMTLVFLVIPFYLSFGNTVGTILSVILFWTTLFLIFAQMYFFPLFFAMQGDRPMKTLKKSFLLVLDNPFFTLFLAVYQVINTLLSLLLAFLAPGFTGISLACSVATKLLLFKYDYLEENPEANRKAIPWDDLLYEEREAVGPRSLKGMIFPWKD
ncbi:MAG: hypothetical protein GX313_07250 [Spirochaetales bacterium]|nr:hypothetical protein [Spirochaetales bacterium]